VDRATGWVALAVGLAAIASVVSLLLLYVVGDPFGTVNDVGNALIGVLGAMLAYRLATTAGGMGIAWGPRSSARS
jgi:hypothetical protein